MIDPYQDTVRAPRNEHERGALYYCKYESKILITHTYTIRKVIFRGFGPEARRFLKFLCKSARERNRWEMSSGQPQVESTWNTLFASTHWDMRLGMACTAMSAEVVGRVFVRDFMLKGCASMYQRQIRANKQEP